MSKKKLLSLIGVVFTLVMGYLVSTGNLDLPEADIETLPEGSVAKVIDGDTVDVVVDGEISRIRLIGIDTPEVVDPRKPVQCFGQEASDKLRSLVQDQLVTLEYDNSQGVTDKYGRTLAYILLSDGTNVAEQMLRDGFAYEYTYNTPYAYQTQFKDAERAARESQNGLWSSDTCGGKR